MICFLETQYLPTVELAVNKILAITASMRGIKIETLEYTVAVTVPYYDSAIIAKLIIIRHIPRMWNLPILSLKKT